MQHFYTCRELARQNGQRIGAEFEFQRKHGHNIPSNTHDTSWVLGRLVKSMPASKGPNDEIPVSSPCGLL